MRPPTVFLHFTFLQLGTTHFGHASFLLCSRRSIAQLPSRPPTRRHLRLLCPCKPRHLLLRLWRLRKSACKLQFCRFADLCGKRALKEDCQRLPVPCDARTVQGCGGAAGANSASPQSQTHSCFAACFAGTCTLRALLGVTLCQRSSCIGQACFGKLSLLTYFRSSAPGQAAPIWSSPAMAAIFSKVTGSRRRLTFGPRATKKSPLRRGGDAHSMQETSKLQAMPRIIVATQGTG